MRIGICEDDLKDRAKLEQILLSIRTGDEIECYSEGAALLETIRDGARYDLLFLDIYLPDMRGTCLATELAAAAPGRPPYLVFVTTSEDFAVEAFSLRALHYIVKPVEQRDVLEVLDRIPTAQGHRQGIQIRFREATRFLYLDEIAFCESSAHRLLIHMMDGEVIPYYETITNMQALLGEGFLSITRGVLVNIDYIEVMKYHSCILKNSREVLLSRRNLKEIHEAYNNFVFERLLDGQGREDNT